jgi:hypothetical protein
VIAFKAALKEVSAPAGISPDFAHQNNFNLDALRKPAGCDFKAESYSSFEQSNTGAPPTLLTLSPESVFRQRSQQVILVPLSRPSVAKKSIMTTSKVAPLERNIDFPAMTQYLAFTTCRRPDLMPQRNLLEILK